MSRKGARVNVVVGTFDEKAYGTAISLGTEVIRFVLGD
jgi:hypothetical protein